MFQNNQRQFHRELNYEGQRSEDEMPDDEESQNNCGSISNR